MEKNETKPLKAMRLDTLSQKWVKDEDLTDAPARLFRQILNKVVPTPHKWTQYLREYLEWIITTTDRDKAKSDRLTRSGNIKETYFQKPSLTFNKLLEGLSILQMESCEIIIKVKDKNGVEHVAIERMRIQGGGRKQTPAPDKDTPSKDS